VAENGGPNEFRFVLEDPELGMRMEEDGDVFFRGWGNLVRLAVELDGVVVVNLAR
jgi:hypothetical protein